MLFSTIIMYTVENPVQTEQFPNVISSLWWVICTLTTLAMVTSERFSSVINERSREKRLQSLTVRIADIRFQINKWIAIIVSSIVLGLNVFIISNRQESRKQ